MRRAEGWNDDAGGGGDATGPVIRVSMDDGKVVLRLRGDLDRDAVHTLLRLLASARAAGADAVVDLEPTDDLTGIERRTKAPLVSSA